MKIILIPIFFLFIGVTTLAQDVKKDSKVEPTQMSIIAFSSYKTATARLYKHKNSKIKKVLDFRTKANKAKLA